MRHPEAVCPAHASDPHPRVTRRIVVFLEAGKKGLTQYDLVYACKSEESDPGAECSLLYAAVVTLNAVLRVAGRRDMAFQAAYHLHLDISGKPCAVKFEGEYSSWLRRKKGETGHGFEDPKKRIYPGNRGRGSEVKGDLREAVQTDYPELFRFLPDAAKTGQEAPMMMFIDYSQPRPGETGRLEDGAVQHHISTINTFGQSIEGCKRVKCALQFAVASVCGFARKAQLAARNALTAAPRAGTSGGAR